MKTAIGLRFATIALALTLSPLALAQAPAMPPQTPLAIDHVILYVQSDAPERRALAAAGFTLAPGLSHQAGQGTSSVSIDFLNGAIELVYVDPAVSAGSNGERITSMIQGRADFDTTGFAPFGLRFHRTAGSPAEFPFPVTKTDLGEVIAPVDRAFTASLSVAPEGEDEAANLQLAADPAKGAVLRHANGTLRMTGVKVVSPDSRGKSAATSYIEASGAASFESGSEWRMILTLDGGQQGKVKDLNPMLPLEIHY